MAADLGVKVDVFESQEEADSASRDSFRDQEDQGSRDGLFRRKKNKQGDEKKSKKPPEYKWLQQQIPACRPVFTSCHAAIGFFIIGVIFLALGIAFLVVAMRLRQVEVPYTNCGPLPEDTMDNIPSFSSCSDYVDSLRNISNFERRDLEDCHCRVDFTVPETLRAPWYVYYRLGNYFQNHRRYISSWDLNQLQGDLGSFLKPSSDCDPIRTVEFGTGDDDTRTPIVPCGAIANSWFNDSFDVFMNRDTGDNMTCCNRTNIAWDSDRSVRFQNPNGASNVSPEDLFNTTMPPNWPRDLANIPGGLENESLIVWFRVSAFPIFRKLYGRLEVDGSTDVDLPAGDYSISLTYNYPVSPYEGTKSLILSEVSWIGGRNLFLGIAYIVTAVLAMIAGLVLLLVHLLCSRWKTTHKDFLNRKY